MKSSTTSDFWQSYKELSPAMKRRAKKAYKLWQENSLHPFGESILMLDRMWGDVRLPPVGYANDFDGDGLG